MTQQVTIATFIYPSEAYPIIAKLENEGIKCFLNDENIISANPFLSNAVGGIKLNIKSSDYEKASVILKEFENKNKIQEVTVNEKWVDYIAVDTYCPNCESHLVYRKKFPFYKTVLCLAFIWLLFPLMYLVKRHYCADCEHTWKQ